MVSQNTFDTGQKSPNAPGAWRTRALNVLLIVIAMVALPVVGFILVQAFSQPEQLPIALIFAGFYMVIVVMAILRRLDTGLRAWVALLIGYAIGVLALAKGGLAGDGRIYLFSLPILALLFIGLRSGMVMAVISLIILGLFGSFAEFGLMDAWLTHTTNPLDWSTWLGAWVNMFMFLVPTALVLWRFIDFQESTLAAEQKATADLAETSELLHQRAEELVEKSRQLAESPRALATAAEVGQVVATILQPEALVRQVVDLVRERFDFYYVGLFLVGDAQQYAVLESGTGEAGRLMKEQGHRLEVGGISMVGAACARGEARISADVRGETIRFENPLLPNTEAEIAVPLMVGERVLGALDVQSEQADAFSQEIVSALQLVANQVAVGLENARLFDQTQADFQELREVYEAMSGEAWRRFIAEQSGLGKLQLGDARVENETWAALFSQARRTGDLVVANLVDGEMELQAMAIPVMYRGVPIGVLGVHRPADAGAWTSEEIALGENLAERMALALENARLFEGVQRRAARERLISEVTGRMRETLDVETVLKTSVDQMYEALGLDEVVVRLVAVDGAGDSSRTLG